MLRIDRKQRWDCSLVTKSTEPRDDICLSAGCNCLYFSPEVFRTTLITHRRSISPEVCHSNILVIPDRQLITSLTNIIKKAFRPRSHLGIWPRGTSSGAARETYEGGTGTVTSLLGSVIKVFWLP